MPNREQREGKTERAQQADASVGRVHVEPEPVPGHTENIPVDGDMRQAPGASSDAGPVAGPVEGGAPSTDPDTEPGTPPGTQSERDRSRGSN